MAPVNMYNKIKEHLQNLVPNSPVKLYAREGALFQHIECSQQPYGAGPVIIPILQKRKLRHLNTCPNSHPWENDGAS